MKSNTIESFRVDHTKLGPGCYVSRKDSFNGQPVTTYDIRMKRPNREEPLSTAAIHTIEHLGAVFLRKWTDAPVVYFGPMGCRTGFYLVLAEEPDVFRAVKLVKQLFDFVLMHEGPIPGASEEECGNASDHDLAGAKAAATEYLWSIPRTPEEPTDFGMEYPK